MKLTETIGVAVGSSRALAGSFGARQSVCCEAVRRSFTAVAVAAAVEAVAAAVAAAVVVPTA